LGKGGLPGREKAIFIALFQRQTGDMISRNSRAISSLLSGPDCFRSLARRHLPPRVSGPVDCQWRQRLLSAPTCCGAARALSDQASEFARRRRRSVPAALASGPPPSCISPLFPGIRPASSSAGNRRCPPLQRCFRSSRCSQLSRRLANRISVTPWVWRLTSEISSTRVRTSGAAVVISISSWSLSHLHSAPTADRCARRSEWR